MVNVNETIGSGITYYVVEDRVSKICLLEFFKSAIGLAFKVCTIQTVTVPVNKLVNNQRLCCRTMSSVKWNQLSLSPSRRRRILLEKKEDSSDRITK